MAKVTLTVADIKAKVKAMLKAYGVAKLNDKSLPHWMNEENAKMAIGEAKGLLTDDRYEVSPKTVKAINAWCDTLKYY
ncbi:hypothetical protein JC221_105 [Yersinia phage JC221]|nr:hypothetical protein JC221_105 [Yersinia phage JC221]